MAGKYHRILGLSAGASKEEIKRAYRRKAMRYHPDLNQSKDAADAFLQLQEAYEGLMDGRTGPGVESRPKAANKEQSVRKAHPNDPYRPAEDVAARHRRKAERELQDGINYYKRYRYGIKYKVTTFIAGLSVLVGILLVLDFGLPFDQEKDVIDRMYYKQVSAARAGGGGEQDYFLEFAPDRVLQVDLQVWSEMNPGDAVVFKRTPLFGLFLEMEKISYGYRQHFRLDHLLDKVVWFMVLLLFMPLARYFLDRPHVSFYFFEFTIRTAVVAVMVFVGYQVYTAGTLFA